MKIGKLPIAISSIGDAAVVSKSVSVNGVCAVYFFGYSVRADDAVWNRQKRGK